MYNELASGNWYFVQAFKEHVYGQGKTIVFAKTKSEASAKAKKWASSKGLNGSIHLYRNNYKRDAQNMVSTGNFVA